MNSALQMGLPLKIVWNSQLPQNMVARWLFGMAFTEHIIPILGWLPGFFFNEGYKSEDGEDMLQAWLSSGRSKYTCFHAHDGICWKVKDVLGDDPWLVTSRKEENPCDAQEHKEQANGLNSTTKQRVVRFGLLECFQSHEEEGSAELFLMRAIVTSNLCQPSWDFQRICDIQGEVYNGHPWASLHSSTCLLSPCLTLTVHYTSLVLTK